MCSSKHLRRGAFDRQQLVERIEWQELQTGQFVQAFLGKPLEHTRHEAVGARIAVAMHAVEQVAALVKEGEIDRPGVHANARDDLARFIGSSASKL